jgi:hypothetical protein
VPGLAGSNAFTNRLAAARLLLAMPALLVYAIWSRKEHPPLDQLVVSFDQNGNTSHADDVSFYSYTL